MEETLGSTGLSRKELQWHMVSEARPLLGHYGQRPNVGELLLGLFGCLAYLILTKETRQRKGMSTYWGVRAIPGIYLGCEVNPHTMVYHHIITDGKTIFSSPNRIKTVPDVYPMRLHLESSPEDNKA